MLPQRWQTKLETNTSDEEEAETEEQQSLWRDCLKQLGIVILIHSVLSMATIALMLQFGKPFIHGLMSEPWADILTAWLTIFLCAPFLWALMRLGSHNEKVLTLWNSGRSARVKIIAIQLLRIIIAAAFISFILGHTIHLGGMLGIFLVIAFIFIIIFSPISRGRGERMTKTFIENLTEREKL